MFGKKKIQTVTITYNDGIIETFKNVIEATLIDLQWLRITFLDKSDTIIKISTFKKVAAAIDK